MDGLSYFDSTGGLCQFSEDTSDGLVKNALVLIEGTHKDNQGVIHEFPPERLLRIASRTNNAMQEGIEIPLMADHSKQLIGSDGSLKKLGYFVSPFECRVITESDLPNPRMRNLIGKLGAFSKAKILNKVDEVRSKLINLLSPGVDLRSERLAEVSAVAFPAIQGPALFAASPLVQDLSFESVKQEQEAFKRQREDLNDAFEIFINTIQRIQRASPEQLTAIPPKQLLLSAVVDFSTEIKTRLGLDEMISQPQSSEESLPYNTNAYAENLTPPPESSYSQQQLLTEFNSVALKRRRKHR